MAPVPDPYHNKRGSNAEDLNNGSPSLIIAGPESSSEEEDHPALDYAEYQPIPNGPDSLEDDSIDYGSLSGLLSALNTHGTYEISSEAISTEENFPSSLVAEPVSNSSCSELTTTLNESLPAPNLRNESENRSSDYAKERVSLWNSEKGSNQIVIDDEKAAEIKAVMAKIVLPNSAIPQWAKKLSDEKLNCHVIEQIKKDKSS